MPKGLILHLGPNYAALIPECLQACGIDDVAALLCPTIAVTGAVTDRVIFVMAGAAVVVAVPVHEKTDMQAFKPGKMVPDCAHQAADFADGGIVDRAVQFDERENIGRALYRAAFGPCAS